MLLGKQGGRLAGPLVALVCGEGAAFAGFVDDEVGNGGVVHKANAVFEVVVDAEADDDAAVNVGGQHEGASKANAEKAVAGVEIFGHLHACWGVVENVVVAFCLARPCFQILQQPNGEPAQTVMFI